MSWFLAFLLCAGGVALETVLAGGDVSAQLKSIKQPAWALPLPGWIAIGLGYYVACFLAAQMLFAGGPLEGWRLVR